MKAEILKMLRENEDFVSGQQLCEELGVSRTAVWKVIGQLKEEGYEVEAVRNRGYRITASPDVMTQEELYSLLDGKTAWAGGSIYYYEETDSTNLRAKQLGDEGAPHGTLAVAEKQTAGRGRRGKSWSSPPGESIYFSILLRPEFSPEKAPMLTLVMAYSTAQALRDLSGADVRIKWPNDIIASGKKMVGILTEMNTEIESESISHVVIGVGINVNMERFPEEVSATATSLKIETGKRFRRGPVLVELLKRFEENYEKFLQTEDISLFRQEYNRLLINCGREVEVLGTKEAYRAEALGVNDKGELLVRRPDGREEAIYAGEVSVRGVYGYV